MSLASLLSDAVGIWKHREPRVSERELDVCDLSDVPPDVRRSIRNGRYCRILLAGGMMPFDESSLACAWRAVEQEMAIVPAGSLRLAVDMVAATYTGLALVAIPSDSIETESIYLDRHCVSNADYARFVEADGYSNPHFWPEEVLPNVLQFTDQTGNPAPRFWSKGAPPADKLDHPVVGVCWYEANAYATWVGKRLPSTEEWQRAGTWPQGHTVDGSEQRYPWGNSFDPSKANLWASGSGGTVPVDHFAAGDTPNGVRQLIGNVWEWVNTAFSPHTGDGVSLNLDQTMAEIRGGAFDTYFHSQATCQFRTGQSLLFRGANVGFRCCVRSSDLPAQTDSALESIEGDS